VFLDWMQSPKCCVLKHKQDCVFRLDAVSEMLCFET
jgi:hypothetical protein